MNDLPQQVFALWEDGLRHRAAGRNRDAADAFVEMSRLCMNLAHGEEERAYLNWAGKALREAGTAQLLDLGDPNTALSSYTEARRIYTKTGATVDEAACVNNSGDCLRELGRLEDSLNSYRESYSLIEGLPYGKGHAITILNCVHICMLLDRNEDALAFAKQGLRITSEAADSERIDTFRAMISQLESSLGVRHEADSEDTCHLSHQAQRVLEMEARFKASHGSDAAALCDRARWAAHGAQEGLNRRELETVRAVPVTSYPMRSLNACMSRLPTGEHYINLSPELLCAYYHVARETGSLLGGRQTHDAFISALQRFVTRLARGIHVFADADKMKEPFGGTGVWHAGATWMALHEYGHCLLGHLGRAAVYEMSDYSHGAETLRVVATNRLEMEKEADAFATERCINAFSQIGRAAGGEVAFATGLLFTLLGATSSVVAGYRETLGERKVSHTHPPFYERLTSVINTCCQVLPDNVKDISENASPWQSLCCSKEAATIWRGIGRALGDGSYQVCNAEFAGTV